MTKVKICGITNIEDARAVVEAGADLLGFIFYEPSPRYVPPEKVREIVQALREVELNIREQLSGRRPGQALPTHHSVTYVGVFVNSPVEMVQQVLDFCRLDGAQLHGEEPPEAVAAFQGRAFKALRPQSEQEADGLIQAYLRPANPPARARIDRINLPTFLLDAYHPQLYGGTGQVTDWSMAARIAGQYPIMLAGSLTPANVAEAIRLVNPWGVDVSSGVEATKGKKDHEKVRGFVEAAKNVMRNS